MGMPATLIGACELICFRQFSVLDAALQNAQNKRETVGVELYGFQQNLAKLQLQLEQAHQGHQALARLRTQVWYS
jgi:hypothetical protein